MNINELLNELNKLKVSEKDYSLTGELKSDAFILNQDYGKWIYFYFDEKGNKEDYHEFETEDMACKYLLEKIKLELSYPTQQFVSW